ncbi:RagB/SusD family nutrient uptake outer membrane protein [Chitinophaga qingshengii]|uniref:RagB/SusD family nutrient uptake outer membrane protein n=1 Tax=Chitinophaga qingshengii TaxID=1569794 RepID=A0ABR7TXE5_9BACT|nr:RagB/SusD family nutrient uptake outer membrane protein [Chitinophaga qingshengii]MBC9934079.1 RagB/SusD family nutrient uptake outer membrane protein [Chitinophaga qingshengii]
MKRINSQNITPIIVLTVILLIFPSCKKFLEIAAPTTSMNAENVYQYDATAASVLTGIYATMMNTTSFTNANAISISLLQDLAADNLQLYDLNQISYLNYWQNSYNGDYANSGGYNYFINFYPILYTINASIEGLTRSNSLTPSIKQHLLGEAHFLRAFYFFYLVNLYGDIPLPLTTDYKINTSLPRAPESSVYKQIISDLNTAKTLLTDTYTDANIISSTGERVRPNYSAAEALLARSQLYTKDYAAAEMSSTEIINKTSLFQLVGLDSVFKKNSKETIWSLQPVVLGYNTLEGATFLLTNSPGTAPNKYFAISSSLQSSFESNDQRFKKWIGKISDSTKTYYFPAKYKIDANNTGINEYCIVFRLAEQYLIRAECRLEQNNLAGAKDDLNAIRNRAGLPAITTSDVNELRMNIQKERRIELFTEWGHRWFDLKRNRSLDSTMRTAETSKGGIWASYKQLYPIPNSEINKNSKLIQNPGY